MQSNGSVTCDDRCRGCQSTNCLRARHAPSGRAVPPGFYRKCRIDRQADNGGPGHGGDGDQAGQPATGTAGGPTVRTSIDTFPHYADGLRLHQLRHSSATHLGEANVSANVIMAKTGHKSLRSLQRYVKPGLAAVHGATESLSSPRRRG
jgi:hypothetical protein